MWLWLVIMVRDRIQYQSTFKHKGKVLILETGVQKSMFSLQISDLIFQSTKHSWVLDFESVGCSATLKKSGQYFGA